MQHSGVWTVQTLQLVMLAMCLPGPFARGADKIPDYTREILPIFRRHCWECHGPKKAESELRFDRRESAVGASVRPGDVAASELYRRITLPRGHDEVMPSRGEPLPAREVLQIRRWIESGAAWPEQTAEYQHWAYQPPVRNEIPPGSNPVDFFVRRRLAEEELKPSPSAEREILLRRVSLDLIGLPPSSAELDAFLADTSPEAWERAVDRLLASDQFGVRWARPWLDAARYADSHGFQRDDFRDIWAYRDWVVDAFNKDMPFDRFTIEQLAGDLLPDATESQRIATGFNRNAPTNVEAGSDPEETRVNQVHDRVNTLGMVWLGTTLECAQCHDHKYDPITTRDYYGLFAFFNTTAQEADRTNPKTPGSIQFQGPEMPLTDPAIDAERARLQQELAQIDERLQSLSKEHATLDPAWLDELAERIATTPREEVLPVAEFSSLGGATHEVLADGSVLLSGEAPDRDTYEVTVKTSLTGIRAIRLDALTDPSLPGSGPGRGDAERTNFVLNTFAATAEPASGGSPAPVRFTGARADFSQAKYDARGAIDDDPRTAWAIAPQFRKPHWAEFACEPLGFAGGTVLRFRLVQNFGQSRTLGRIRLTAILGNAGATAIPADVVKAVETPANRRTDKQNERLREYRLQQLPEYARQIAGKQKLQAAFAKVKLPTTLVMQEVEQPRVSRMFERGDFRNPGETVSPATPSALPPLEIDAGTPRNRLTLARWLVDGRNPLVARVTVNRYWAELFGHGLVTTAEDFGIKGEPPTHPELLDRLAVEFQQNGWQIKPILRTIVLSETYRQSSHVTPALASADDRNLLYARGPRFRLEAEAIRDNALSIAGLLNPQLGGPPIRPEQPDGLWVKVGGQRYDYVVSPGTEKNRRGLFVVWKRGAPYPSFVTFDANSRLACRVNRPRSNTPLQALTLMNDPVYVEAALAFAKRIVTENPAASTDDRLVYAFRTATARKPRPAELAVLRQLFESQRTSGSSETETSGKLFGQDVVLPAGISRADYTAWYAVAAAILNLDETITKG